VSRRTDREQERIPCLINPEAGSAAEAAERLREDRRFRLQQCDPARLEAAVRAEVERGAGRVVVSGGDGTVAAAAGVLAGSAVELAVLPGGTLNHFARSLGIPTALEAALEVAAHGSARRVDVGYVNDRLFLNTSSVGAYVAFVHTREAWEPRLGYWLAGAWAALRMVARAPAYSVEVEVDGEHRRYLAPVAFVGVGERELRAPVFGERVEGGRRGLHLLVVQGRARARLFAMMLAAAARGLRVAARTPHLDSFLVERCTLSLRRPHAYVGLDGETVRLTMPLCYRIESDALSVVAPPPGDGADPG
jgi:diacylglycerol kinase family enzyme